MAGGTIAVGTSGSANVVRTRVVIPRDDAVTAQPSTWPASAAVESFREAPPGSATPSSVQRRETRGGLRGQIPGPPGAGGADPRVAAVVGRALGGGGGGAVGGRGRRAPARRGGG